MIFDYVSAILMLIIGLGLTHLLGDVVFAFQDRKRTRPHWLPMVWAGIIFAEQMQFLWAIYELKEIKADWTSGQFILMLVPALLHFSAGALVVPRDNEEGTDGWTLFLENGRWSLALLALYDLIAVFANMIMFETPFMSAASLVNLLFSLLLTALIFARNRRIWLWGTLLYCIAIVLSGILLSPVSYE